MTMPAPIGSWKVVWFGTVGPFYYDDGVDALDPELLYDGVAAPPQSAFITDGQLDVATAPVLDVNVLRLVDVGTLVGDVIGPGASTDHAIVRWDGVSGTLVQDSLTIINDAGLISFGAGAGLRLGHCYGDHIDWTQGAAAVDTWYNIHDADMVSGVLRDVTHDGFGTLTVGTTGIYFISFDVAWECNGANIHTEFGIGVDGADPAADSPHVHTTSKFINQEGQNASSGIMPLTAGETIQVAIRTTDGTTPNYIVDNIHLTCILIGGE